MEPQFTLQRAGERKPSDPQPLSALLDANRDDESLCEWLSRAQVGGSYIDGGGAAPAVSVRRVA